MTEEEFDRANPRELKAYAKVYEAVQRRMDYRSAQIVAILAEINRDTKKRSIPFSAEDFMPRVKQEKEQVLAKCKKFGEYLNMVSVWQAKQK